jgi:transcriptional adapter 2-alpha
MAEKVQCRCCDKDISAEIHISCAICRNVELCLQCFSSGVEFESHLRNHAYRIRKNDRIVIFDPNWTKDEEYSLLDSVDKNGLGNWKDVALDIGTKDAAECEFHYFQFYVNSIDLIPSSGDSKAVPCVAPNLPPAMASLPPSLSAEFAGYRPRRGDYEQECLPDAEMAIRDMVLYDDDPPHVRDLKLAMIEIYNRRLDKRMERRHLAQVLQLQNASQRQQWKDNVDFEAFRLSLRPFAQFNESPEKHAELLQGFLETQRMQKRVRQLQDYRQNGITTFADAAAYDTARLAREQRGGRGRGRGRGGHLARRSAAPGSLPAGDLLTEAEQQVALPVIVIMFPSCWHCVNNYILISNIYWLQFCETAMVLPAQFAAVRAFLFACSQKDIAIDLGDAASVAACSKETAKAVWCHLVATGKIPE